MDLSRFLTKRSISPETLFRRRSSDTNMKRDPEEANHPRLLMLSEFDGKIEGELKYHKSVYQYRERAELVDEDELEFVREEHGPTDRGFSSVLQSYEDLELVEEEQSGNRRDFVLKEKGKRVAKGLKRGLSKLDDTFSERMGAISKVEEQNKDRSGSQIVEDEDVQAAKDNSYQSKL